MLMNADLTQKQFQKVCRLVYRHCGIHLKRGKEALVRARLMKRMRALKIGSIKEYLAYIDSDEGIWELEFMIDAMTTNKTSFFRESTHFHFLKEEILPKLKQNRLRLWSAACSSGEEPFSIAITLRENLPDIDSRDVLVLGTDISNQMLEIAGKAAYRKDAIQDLPPHLIYKYFIRQNSGAGNFYSVNNAVRKMVRLARLNLIEQWPMKGLFNVIFCRNVMIYFDRATQQSLINRFYEYLEPGGYLFVGHSEGLSAIKHKLRYVKPAIYQK